MSYRFLSPKVLGTGITAFTLGLTMLSGVGYSSPSSDEKIVIYHQSATGKIGQSLYSKSEISPAGENAEDLVRGILNRIANEAEAGNASYPFPVGTQLENIRVDKTESGLGIAVGVRFPESYLESARVNLDIVDSIHETLNLSLSPHDVDSFNVTFYNPKTGRFETVDQLLFGPTPKPEVPPVPDAQIPVQVVGEKAAVPATPPHGVSGILNGKNVVLNQSHGWYYSGGEWKIERSKIWDSLEDFESPEFINLFVIPALMNAGAVVKPVREPDHQTEFFVVDNADTVPLFDKQGAWTQSDSVGFRKQTSYSGVNQADNPFGEPNSTDIVPVVTGTPTASATFTFNVPKDGYYNTYVTYSAGPNRTSDAHYVVNHSGGSTPLRIDQKKNGGTWLLLGRYYYEANSPEEKRSIQVFNDASVAGEVVSIDAARIGGGQGIITRYAPSTSGRPRWQDSANHYLPYTGMMNSNLWYTNTGIADNEVAKVNRARFSQWEQVRNNDGNNTIYIAWHTNAHQGGCVDGTDTNGASTAAGAKGLETWRTLSSNPDNPAEVATPGSVNLATNVHNALLNGVRKFYNASFVDRGVKQSAGYPEVTRANLGDVSGILIEGLFHDYSVDMHMYKDPKFRMIAARALTQGVISHFGGNVFPPETPENLSVRNTGNNQVQLSWTAGPVRTGTMPYGSAATGYRIFKSINGYGFDNGTDVGNVTNYTVTLQPGETAYFRVVAVNSAGVSFPTETLGARTPLSGSNPTVLVVNGYDRFDRMLGIITDAPGIKGCVNSNPDTWRSMDYNRFNTFNYVVRHGNAIAASDFPFDSVSRTVVSLPEFNLNTYQIVDWIGGQQSEDETSDIKNDEAFTAAEITKLNGYLAEGKNLFVSNSRLAWDFGRPGQPSPKQSFLGDSLKTTYVAESAGVTKAGATGGLFSGLTSIDFNGESDGAYNVQKPAVIAPGSGAVAALVYEGGTYNAQPAAVQYEGTVDTGSVNSRIVNMSFGFEAIQTEEKRNAVMQRVLYYFTGSGIGDWSMYE